MLAASATIRIRIVFAHREKADCITVARRIVLLYCIYSETPRDDSRTLSRIKQRSRLWPGALFWRRYILETL
jgi:hypothetical protein